MRFYIPSYKRPLRCITVDYLLSCGVGFSDIYISTQTEEDLQAYSEQYGHKCNVIYAPANSCAGNRNSCILHARSTNCERFVLMDDDVISIMSFLPKRDTPINRGNFAQFIEGVERLLNSGVSLCGLYPISNNMFALKQPRISKTIVVGVFLAFGTNKHLFNPEFKIKDDFELSLRLISGGASVVRLNWFYSKIILHAAGGCKDDYDSGYSSYFGDKLLTMYPDLLKRGRKKGEIAFK